MKQKLKKKILHSNWREQLPSETEERGPVVGDVEEVEGSRGMGLVAEAGQKGAP